MTTTFFITLLRTLECFAQHFITIDLYKYHSYCTTYRLWSFLNQD